MWCVKKQHEWIKKRGVKCSVQGVLKKGKEIGAGGEGERATARGEMEEGERVGGRIGEYPFSLSFQDTSSPTTGTTGEYDGPWWMCMTGERSTAGW